MSLTFLIPLWTGLTFFGSLGLAQGIGDGSPLGRPATPPKQPIVEKYIKMTKEDRVDAFKPDKEGLAKFESQLVALLEKKVTLPPDCHLAKDYIAGLKGSHLWAASFTLVCHEIPVMRAVSVFADVKDDGHLFYIRTRTVPTRIDTFQPEVTAEEAVETAKEYFGAPVRDREPVVLGGAPKLEIFVGEDGIGHLAWTFAMDVEKSRLPVHRKIYWISATSPPKLLLWEPGAYF